MQLDQNDDDSFECVENDFDNVSPLTTPDELVNPDASEINKLVDEQNTDETLSGTFELVKVNKGGYFLRNDLLCHRTRIRDSVVDRLVVRDF